MRLSPARVSILVLLTAVWILQPANLASQAQQAADRARGHSARHLDDLAARHGNGDTSHREMRLQIDERGRAHRKVQQLHRGVPVFGGDAIVHTADNGTLEGVTDNYITAIGPVDTTPILTPVDAINAALAAYGADASVLTAAPRVDLWILRQDGDHLAYRVRLSRIDGTRDTAMPVYFIDAADGRVLFGYNNLQTQSTTGTGATFYSGTVSIPTYQAGASYYLQDVNRKIGTSTANSSTLLPGTVVTDADNIFDSASQKAAVDAQYGSSKTYDYYLNVHGRHGIDDLDGPSSTTAADGTTRLLLNVVHYGNNYCNAFWNGQLMVYGDGTASQGCGPVVAIDVTGHEMTHGVIERTAGLIYSGEPGGLNESFADIFGAMIERYARGMSDNVWLIGEEPLPPFVRSMADPPSDGGSRDYYTSTIGNIDVHYSSGVQNKAFYLLSVGGTHHSVTVTAIGPDKAEKIFFKALTTYMTSTTKFAGARTATLSAAADLYGNGSDEYDAVATAWCAVGVGACPVADLIPPSTTASAAGYSFGTWTNQDVTVTLDAVDNADGSGVDTLVYSASGATMLPPASTAGHASITVTAEGDTTISFHATDVAGNIEATQTRDVRIDRTAPTITLSAAYIFGNWINHNVSVIWSASDDRSGVATVVYSASGAGALPPTTTGGSGGILFGAEGETIVTFEATDVAGNTHSETRVLRIDKTAPSATASAGGYSFGTLTNQSLTVSLDSADNTGGSGVAALVYSASGATTLPATTTGGSAVINVNADGDTIISFHSIDVAGNSGPTETRVVRIDRGGPSATAAALPSALWPPNGKLTPVTIRGTIQDPSGVSSASYIVNDEYGQASSAGAVAVSSSGAYSFVIQLPASRLGTDTDGRTFRIRIVVTDVAGNAATAETRVIVPHSQGK